VSIQTPGDGAKKSKVRSGPKGNGNGTAHAGSPTDPSLALKLEELSGALRSLKAGDFDVRLSPGERGPFREVAAAFNDVAAMLDGTSVEFVRVSRVVGRDGKLMERARVKGAHGGWASQLESFNALIGDLVRPSTEVARVIIAVAAGDLSQKMALEIEGQPVRGEFLRISTSVNTMVEQLRSLASEVLRVAKEVGTDGKLGGQAQLEMSGVWKDLTNGVNGLADNLTSQVRNIALVTTAVANGDLSQKIDVEARGELLELKTTVNRMVDQLSSFASDVTRVAKEVGTDGKLGGQAEVKMSGTWKDLTDNVNRLAWNLTSQVRNIALVTTAVANGDLSQKIEVEARGELLELKTTVNKMVDQLSSFASEVTRVAKEVGTGGKLGGQAEVPGVAGTWKALTDNVNSMSANLAGLMHNIAEVTTAIAMGDLSRKITVDLRGDFLKYKTTQNTMVDQLNAFASEVTRVAREVGTEGKLGGQALVPGAAGTWRDLTHNVNQLANNLTGQVRAIMEVSIAVTQGDLTRSISVEAQGEVLALRENLNQMIANLRDTTQKNQEQDWLKTNLAKFTGMMQGQRDLEAISRLIMSELTPLVSAQQGAFFVAAKAQDGSPELRLLASYAYRERKSVSNRFRFGEGIVGQSALEKKSILLSDVPIDYIQINSGLGHATPLNIIVIPILFEDDVRAVIELASFKPFSPIYRNFMDQLSASIGVVLNMIGASMRTEELLNQSQSLAEELQNQSQELQQQQLELKSSNNELEAQTQSLKTSEERLTEQQQQLQQVNQELEEKAALLFEQKGAVELKNKEVELARRALEEKAEQLSVSSKYKSEFLANMSHELRTPLNSLLILARMLGDNKEATLTPKQVEYARTIQASGTDLLNLINEVLDLSKVEAGKIEINSFEQPLAAVEDYLERSFRPLAQQQGLEFVIERERGMPSTLVTDGQRLQQILRNLLANAFKFTDTGKVSVHIGLATDVAFATGALQAASKVVAFTVTDTGIGIAESKQQLIFGAFQQAEGTTSRTYGGTGLGLSISRELAGLLGGEIRVRSALGKGSTFTFYLPLDYLPRSAAAPETPDTAAKVTDPASVVPFARAFATAAVSKESLQNNPLADDRDAIGPGDRVLLIVEDDEAFARGLLGLARENGFKTVVAVSGEVGLALALSLRPDAIVLDIGLPVLDGLAILARLKQHLETRHIPVQLVSGRDKKQHGLKLGARAYLEKPVSKQALETAFGDMGRFLARKDRRLLVVEAEPVQQRAILELLGDGDVVSAVASSAAEALTELQANHYDCMVLGLALPDMTGFDLLDEIASQQTLRSLPIIIYTGKELTRKQQTRLTKYAATITVKAAMSPERLLDETTLFLHRVEANLPEEKRRVLKRLHNPATLFKGKRVLVVDDDMRNVFAITSVLEANGMEVIFAERGQHALDILQKTPGVDLVVMDVMMPDMDGYETMRAVRLLPQFRTLPMIALTAKAMKGDREKCIEAGASDYVTKPVDPDQLISILHTWMYR